LLFSLWYITYIKAKKGILSFGPLMDKWEKPQMARGAHRKRSTSDGSIFSLLQTAI
jgi:hypothetical protein